jgi:hypothetical protein
VALVHTWCQLSLLVDRDLLLVLHASEGSIMTTGGPSWGPYRATARSPQDKSSVFGPLNLGFIYKYRPILTERPGLVGLSRFATDNDRHVVYFK